MKGIKSRLVGSYLFIIIITVFILEAVLIAAIKKYYYNNTQNLLSNQIKISVEFYNNYFSSSTLEENVRNNADIFWKNTSAEVQIINKDSKMLMDSIGNFVEGTVVGEDIEKALKGKLGTDIKKDDVTGENVLYVSYPLKSASGIEGVLRFISSLSKVDSMLNRISLLFFIIGLFVIIISSMVSIFLSNTIIEPLEEVNKVAEKFASGTFNERLIIRRDDEIGELASTLNFMADEIIKNERLKNDFISSVSHELRTPLTSIKGWAATIKLGDLEDKEEVYEGLEIIEKESDRLSLLVEELLDFSKLISGKVNLKKEYVEIDNLARFIKNQMKPRANRENIKFTMDIEKNIPPILLDKNRISQVILNILDNAFKFTPKEGYIIFSVYKDENYLVIKIKDSGTGISKEDLPHVTEKFFKGKNSMSKNGIGLSVCKEIVELHEGILEINSELNKGTIVYVKIPYEL
ncbi:alkaline phosphatase synthesis sensor protein PhoR [Clostridium acetireducens DSM 10703]|uniref:histidine kinase n=1 Tax=Clostridium acetireducens DSM 10703 TaxID=1121290 RepID=A0A1E8F028_9CLOT|nr:ATP-binding protein [Clostridium acetireducens]OFI06761.1 alkaline phosphatase synthesis sensor protein PhoR [Clostridium acetireducens DSM 10703]